MALLKYGSAGTWKGVSGAPGAATAQMDLGSTGPAGLRRFISGVISYVFLFTVK